MPTRMRTGHDPPQRVLYPETEGATFDHDYYRDKHVPLALKAWGLESARDRQEHRRPLRCRRSRRPRRRWPRRAPVDVTAYAPITTTITPVTQVAEVVPGVRR